MRLIDADDVIKTISHYLDKAMYALYPNDKMPDFVKGMIDGYARARSIVFETPTVYPVKHGRWIFSQDHREGLCTRCNFKIYGRPYNNTYMIVPYNYCPNCGARMDEEAEHDDHL